MIKVNLSNAKKALDLSDLGGFDFTKLKVKAVLISIVLIYAPDFVLVPMWEEQLVKQNELVTSQQGQLNNLKRKVSQSADFEKQIQELKLQEESLRQKLTAVKQAISEKKNPSTLLLFIAKNMPVDLWINELTIEGEIMVIRGEALSYTSVGNFVSSLRSSVFIKDSNIVNTTSLLRGADKRRIESFEVNFMIARFE